MHNLGGFARFFKLAYDTSNKTGSDNIDTLVVDYHTDITKDRMQNFGMPWSSCD